MGRCWGKESVVVLSKVESVDGVCVGSSAMVVVVVDLLDVERGT